MLRSFAVLVFIAGIAAAAIYVAGRPTVARGSVLAARLLETNKDKVAAFECTDAAIGVSGAKFSCLTKYKAGGQTVVEFTMDRAGTIQPTSGQAHVKKTADPWGE